MSSSIKPYPRMRRSGVSWLGEIPEHWQLLPNRSVFREIKSVGHEDEQLLSVTISRGVIRQSELLATTSKKDSSNTDKSKYKLVEPGDLAYNKMRAWQGAVGISDYRGIVSPAYIVQRLRAEGVPRYFHYLFRTRAFATEAERWSYGITSDQWSLRPQHFKMIYVCVPPSDEQARIVRYLNAIDGKVSKYIHNKRRLMSLLAEEIQCLTDRLIRTGIDETKPRGSTGERWIEELPSHWELRRLHHLLDPSAPLAYGILVPGPHVDGGVPYIGAGDVRPERLHLELLPRTSEEIAKAYPRTRMRAGELVYAIRGSFGRVEVIPPELEGVNLSRDAARLVPRTGINPEWLVQALRSNVCQQQFTYREIGAAITGVNIRDLKRVVIPVPPDSEQAEIVSYLGAATSDSLRAIKFAEREIELVREYRNRLVADVMTGKLDVREAAMTLADDLHEVEPLDDPGLVEGKELEEIEPQEFDEVPA